MQYDKKKMWKGIIIAMVLFWGMVALFYFGEGEQLFIRETVAPVISVEGDIATPEITRDFSVQYTFSSDIDIIDSFSIRFASFARQNTGRIHVALRSLWTGQVLYEQDLDVSTIADGTYVEFLPEKDTIYKVRDQVLSIEFSSVDAVNGNAVAPWVNSTSDIKINGEETQLLYNGVPTQGELCINVNGRDLVWTGVIFKYIISGVFLCYLLIVIFEAVRYRKGKKTVFLLAVGALKKYGFLIKQLVGRDFKTKYKKSFFGVLWSFINPLLIMIIQYVVFSEIFKADIEYYPVYIMSGFVIFNFFSEAVGMSIESIIGNAALITKVYVPKYIYPFTRVCSSCINLFISLILLVIVALVSGVSIKISILLIVFPMVFLFVFSLGLGLMLSSAMVFFRDIRFLWNAISLVWMYATPIFYPVEILPERYAFVLDINPLNYILTMFRNSVLYGKGSNPRLFVTCALISLITFCIGAVIFKKNQDKFILHI